MFKDNYVNFNQKKVYKKICLRDHSKIRSKLTYKSWVQTVFLHKNRTIQYILIKIGTQSNHILANALLKFHINQWEIFGDITPIW